MDAVKRTDDQSVQSVQSGNQSWWTKNPMAYDWHGEIAYPQFSREWFDAIDARFLHGARLFATDKQPFDRIMPLERLAGKRVLEIGCGMGLHTETLLRAGAKVTSVDLSATSVEATTKRLALKGLTGDVRQADAEQLPFDAASFDFVWSWGVIHHSSRTGRIVREIARVLAPDGEARVMVYNRVSTVARVAFWKDYVFKLGFLRHSYEEILYRTTDGFSARFYVPEQFEDLFRTFFKDVKSEVCGMEADALPLPRRVRRVAMKLVSERWMRRKQAKNGYFLFLTATHPG
jgi:2-polyprenyl-3-methyl-5-hydroxy-6-metoxy-1,4-benzoquinol methylase